MPGLLEADVPVLLLDVMVLKFLPSLKPRQPIVLLLLQSLHPLVLLLLQSLDSAFPLALRPGETVVGGRPPRQLQSPLSLWPLHYASPSVQSVYSVPPTWVLPGLTVTVRCGPSWPTTSLWRWPLRQLAQCPLSDRH